MGKSALLVHTRKSLNFSLKVKANFYAYHIIYTCIDSLSVPKA